MQTRESTVSEWVRQLYSICLGANLGFLPFLMIFLILQAGLDPITAFLLWLLTSAVVVVEWWIAQDFFQHYPAAFQSGILTFLSVLINGLYVVALLVLPALLMMEGPDHISLFWYASGLLALAALDILLELLYLSAEHPSRVETGIYIFTDVVAIILYAVFLLFVVPSKYTMLVQTLCLVGFYIVEFTAYLLLAYAVRPRLVRP